MWRFMARRLLLCLTMLALISGAQAQSFPTKPLRIIVPFPPGGGSDNVMRILAEKLGQELGQPVVIENRVGAGGNIGATAAARATADGYTLFNCNIATHGISPATRKKMPYDAEKDFTGVSMVGSVPNLLVVNPSVPAKNVAEFIAWAKAGAGNINFASPGIGTSPDMTMELLMLSTGIKLTRVTYKGAAPALLDVMAGHVPMTFASVGELLPNIQAGRLRPIAVTSIKRDPALTDVPSFDEAGVSGFLVISWNHVCTTAGTPEAVLNTLNTAAVKSVNSAEVRDKLSKMGVVPQASTREELNTFIRTEIAKWQKVARTAGIALED